MNNPDKAIPDSLRVLREAQQSAVCEAEISRETVEQLKNADLSELSSENVFAEMETALMNSRKPSIFFEQLKRMEQLDVWFPEIAALIGIKQNEQYHREGDVWVHTMLVLDNAAAERNNAKQPLMFMLSALCHDLGKAVTSSVDDSGITHSYRHESEGLPIVSRFLERLTDNKKLTEYVLNMTEMHMQPNRAAAVKSRIKSTNKMYEKSVEPYDLILLADCDNSGRLPVVTSNRSFLMSRLELYYEIMNRPYVTEKDLTGTGMKICGDLSEVLEYAHKLRLAGVEKSNALRQTLAYAKKKGLMFCDNTGDKR